MSEEFDGMSAGAQDPSTAGPEATAAEDAKRASARENWRRVKELFSWIGKNGDADWILQRIKRLTPDAPYEKLRRASRGEVQGAGALHLKNARALVGPLLGVDYLNDRPSSILSRYQGPASDALRDHLKSLADDRLVELADHWVDYVRRKRDDPPPHWSEAPSPPGPPNAPRTLFEDWPEEPEPDLERPAAQSDAKGAGEGTKTNRRALPLTIAAVVALACMTLVATRETQDAVKPAAAEAKDITARRYTPIRLSMLAERAGYSFAIGDGALVRSGDRLAFEIEAVEPVYVSVFVIGKDGAVIPIYPARQPTRLLPGTRSRVPGANEGAFQLDDQVGTERLLLLATTHPLPTKRADLLPLFDVLVDQPDWPTTWPKPRLSGEDTSTVPEATAVPGKQASEAKVLTRGISLVKSAPAERTSAPAVLVAAQFVTLEHR